MGQAEAGQAPAGQSSRGTTHTHNEHLTNAEFPAPYTIGPSGNYVKDGVFSHWVPLMILSNIQILAVIPPEYPIEIGHCFLLVVGGILR